jgi:thioredoxin 1
MEKVRNVTNENFNEVVLNSKVPVLVDFYAGWCGPCKNLAPTMDLIAEEYKDVILVTKVDVDVNSDISSEYRVRNIPAILIFKNGEVFDKKIGESSVTEYKTMINRALEA